MNNQQHQSNNNTSTVQWQSNSNNTGLRASSLNPSPAMLGIVAGLVLSIYLGLINGAMDTPGAIAKVFKYLLLGGFLTWALVRVERNYPAGKITPRAFVHAAWINGIAAVIVALANLLFYAVNPEWGFEKFVESDGTGMTAIAYSGILLFEVFVIGMIIAFMLIQLLKRRTSDEKI